MSKEWSSVSLSKCAETEIGDEQYDYIGEAIREIGFIAACIDLNNWRRVILCEVEVEAENGKANFPRTAIHATLTSTSSATSSPAIPRLREWD